MELFSPGHLVPLLIVVAILFFGWKQLPDMARSVGKSLRIFKTEMKGMTEDDAARAAHQVEQIEQTPVPPATQPQAESQPSQPTNQVSQPNSQSPHPTAE